MKYSIFWLLFSLASLLIGVHNNKQAIAQSTEQTDSATMEEIIDNTDNWIGKTVTITGKIDEVKDDSSFTLEGDNYFDSDRVLIINDSGAALPEMPEENITLLITGRVDKVQGVEYFDSSTGADADDSTIDGFEAKPAIYADSIVLAPDPVEIVESPANFYGRNVAVSGRVAAVLDDNAFTLKEFSLNSDQNLLVLNTTGEPMPESGAGVLVRGTVRAYDKEQLEQEYGYDEDLSVYVTDESENESADTAVLIVEEIAPSDVEPSEVDIDVIP